jgi:hypothetical protein
VRPISADVPRHRTLPLCVDYYLIVHCSQTAASQKRRPFASLPHRLDLFAIMFRFTELALVVASFSLASAHTVITYPGWRGNNILTNGTTSPTDPAIKPGSIGINYENGTYGFPYGMQWMYPCMSNVVAMHGTTANSATGGGMPTSSNRTYWPLTGGAIALQPGWFPGHQVAQFYFNMGYGNEPLNYSHAMMPAFAITGPSNQQYDGTFCMPQVPLPAGYNPKVGDNATIQVIELAQHGASLYNVGSSLA